MIRRALMRWLLPDEVYVAARFVPSPGVTVQVFNAHTDFDGANEELAGHDGVVRCVKLVVD